MLPPSWNSRGGHVEGERDLLARLVAGGGDRLEDHLDAFLVRLDVGREAALVADRRGVALLLERALERVEGLGARAQRVREAREAVRDDHELLEVDLVVGMGAAVQDVHEGHRQRARVDAADVAVERQAGGLGRGLGDRQRDGQDRVRAELGLELGAVEVDHQPVDERLVERVLAHHLGRELVVDRGHGLQHALAQVAALVAVAQLHRLALAGRGARRHGGAAHRAAFEHDLDLDGRVAAAVEDLAGENGINRCHDYSSSFVHQCRRSLSRARSGCGPPAEAAACDPSTPGGRWRVSEPRSLRLPAVSEWQAAAGDGCGAGLLAELWVHQALLARGHDDDAAGRHGVAATVLGGVVADDRAARQLDARGR